MAAARLRVRVARGCHIRFYLLLFKKSLRLSIWAVELGGESKLTETVSSSEEPGQQCDRGGRPPIKKGNFSSFFFFVKIESFTNKFHYLGYAAK